MRPPRGTILAIKIVLRQFRKAHPTGLMTSPLGKSNACRAHKITVVLTLHCDIRRPCRGLADRSIAAPAKMISISPKERRRQNEEAD